MTIERPPTIDPLAAQRWALRVPAVSPWLHEEVARRMEARLQWMAQAPKQWLHWGPLQGGLNAQALLTQRYADATCYVYEEGERPQEAVRGRLAAPWWNLARRAGRSPLFGLPDQPVQMLLANMALHAQADPLALMQRWHANLAVDGFLMFSCLGPDTLRELRGVYAAQGWPAPCHEFTDMHDWGDMLVQAGFAEPVMDMERITLSYSSPETLLGELRGLGRNLHPRRHPALRGRAWHAALLGALGQGLTRADASGRLVLSFEVIYGHAFKPAARMPVKQHSVIGLQDLRDALASNRTSGKSSG